MIFSEVLSQYIMSNMISSAISKAGLINEPCNSLSAFNDRYFAVKIVVVSISSEIHQAFH